MLPMMSKQAPLMTAKDNSIVYAMISSTRAGSLLTSNLSWPTMALVHQCTALETALKRVQLVLIVYQDIYITFTPPHSCVDNDPTAIPDNWFYSDLCRCSLHVHLVQLLLEFRNSLTNDWM